MSLWILIWIIAAVIMFGAIIYNRIMALRQEILNIEADIGMQEKIMADSSLGAASDIGARIEADKKLFNDSVTEYNLCLKKFPGSVVARIFKFQPIKIL